MCAYNKHLSASPGLHLNVSVSSRSGPNSSVYAICSSWDPMPFQNNRDSNLSIHYIINMSGGSADPWSGICWESLMLFFALSALVAHTESKVCQALCWVPEPQSHWLMAAHMQGFPSDFATLPKKYSLKSPPPEGCSFTLPQPKLMCHPPSCPNMTLIWLQPPSWGYLCSLEQRPPHPSPIHLESCSDYHIERTQLTNRLAASMKKQFLFPY